MTTISPAANLILVNTRSNTGTITLPPTTQIPFRMITIKDSQGAFSTNALTVNTTAGDFFEDGTTTQRIFTSYGNVQYVASTNRWFTIAGTQVNSFFANTIGTTFVSTNTLSTNNLTLSSLTFRFNVTSTATLFQSTGILYFVSTPLIGQNVAQGITLFPGPSFSISTFQARVETFGGGVVYTYRSTTGTNVFSVTGTVSNAELLMVGGGGAGGFAYGRSGGGGGAGGFLNFSTNFTTSNYTLIVGAGGRTLSTNTGGYDTIFPGIATAFGGGGGAQNDLNSDTIPVQGGSGGGGSALTNTNFGLGIPGQGNNGGVGFPSGVDANLQAAGGGGGAGSVGSNGASSAGGNGGSGRVATTSGTSFTYAGGGGGGKRTSTGTAGTGGSGGGGNGGLDADGSAGTDGLGGGGGGAGGGGAGTARNGGKGGDGVIIIRVYTS